VTSRRPGPVAPGRRRPAVTVPVIVVVLVVPVILRGWQLAHRSFYGDDLVIPSRFRDSGLWVPYDGHLMPGSAALQIVVDAAAPLQWWLPTLVIVVAGALSAVLWWRVSTVWPPLARRPVLRATALVAVVFSPFLMVGSGWWSVAVNALSWQLTAAALILVMSRLSGRGAPASTVASCAVLLAGLFMTERVLTVVPALLVLAVAAGRFRWRRWVGPAVLTVAWAVLYLFLGGLSPADNAAPRGAGVSSGIVDALRTAIIPGTVGGPWTWERWGTSHPFATTVVALQILAAAVAVAAVALILRRTGFRRGVAAFALPVGYLVVVLLLLTVGRGGSGSSDILVRGMHYWADWWTVSVLSVTVALTRAPARAARHSNGAVTMAPAVLFLCSSVVATVTWTGAWDDDPTASYLSGLRKTVTENPGFTDQPVPLEVLTPLMNPWNRVSEVAGRVAPRGGTATSTTRPVLIGLDGRPAPAEISPESRSASGDVPDCGIRVDSGRPQVVALSPALPFGQWTWEFNAVASSPVTVTLSTPNGLEDEATWRGHAVDVPVGTDLQQRWVTLDGGGGTVLVEVHGGAPDSHLCLGAGPVGPLVPSR
jgi:hypothetical protein